MSPILLLLAALPAAAADTAPAVRVPHGPAPSLDGRMAPGEWDGSHVQHLPDGTELHLRRDGEHLYLALRSPDAVLGSLCAASGDTVRVLHASAALGTAVYAREGDAWAVRGGFDYTLRETDSAPETGARRAAFLRAHGWLANNVRTGEPGVREYAVHRRLLGRPARLGLAGLRMRGEGEVFAWPAAEGDDCGLPELVRGFTPERLRFRPETWIVLKGAGAGEGAPAAPVGR